MAAIVARVLKNGHACSPLTPWNAVVSVQLHMLVDPLSVQATATKAATPHKQPVLSFHLAALLASGAWTISIRDMNNMLTSGIWTVSIRGMDC